ncbi:MAG: putative ATP-dependent DNA helicase PIF1 [Streblomastix strix]|uniref:Putative ATP-dependent DNA helicase PIF1 n=1 Tax=Streblomastix strix TaxID=222440 RepID=A0A5J4W5A1_9EUKA|nr:MAG: putative ATP-dependent DNA helicase PIF1 [Streblomastix strix]
MKGQSRLFESVGTLKSEYADDQRRFTDKLIRSITLSGLPLHRLILKIGAIVMLLRSIDVKRGLCNGTRLAVIMLSTPYLKLQGIVGKFQGKYFFLPRLDLEPTNANQLFQITRRQFSIRLAFAMTINNSQGRSFDQVSVFLNRQVLAHGQLYVAFSRCRSLQGLKIPSLDFAGRIQHKARNVVVNEILQ